MLYFSPKKGNPAMVRVDWKTNQEARRGLNHILLYVQIGEKVNTFFLSYMQILKKVYIRGWHLHELVYNENQKRG